MSRCRPATLPGSRRRPTPFAVCLTAASRVRVVSRPTTPVTGARFSLVWNCITAAFVIDPKWPVSGTVFPTSVSHVWSVLTSAPWSPCLSVRVNTDPDDVGFTIPVGALGLTIAAPPETREVEAIALVAGASSGTTRRTASRETSAHRR